MNQIRSLLLERGHVIPQGRAKLAAHLAELLDGQSSGLSPRIHTLVLDMRGRWLTLDERINKFDGEFHEQADRDALTQRLLTIPGIGSLNATALVAAIGDARTFTRGRDLAALAGARAETGDDRG